MFFVQVWVCCKSKVVATPSFFKMLYEIWRKGGGKAWHQWTEEEKVQKVPKLILKEDFKNVLKMMSLYLEPVLPSLCMLMRREIPEESSWSFHTTLTTDWGFLMCIWVEKSVNRLAPILLWSLSGSPVFYIFQYSILVHISVCLQFSWI